MQKMQEQNSSRRSKNSQGKSEMQEMQGRRVPTVEKEIVFKLTFRFSKR